MNEVYIVIEHSSYGDNIIAVFTDKNKLESFIKINNVKFNSGYSLHTYKTSDDNYPNTNEIKYILQVRIKEELYDYNQPLEYRYGLKTDCKLDWNGEYIYEEIVDEKEFKNLSEKDKQNKRIHMIETAREKLNKLK